MGITTKRRVFIDEYLKCWNATEAARKAGYKKPRRQGSRLLSFVDIKEEIQRRLAEKTMSADEALMRLSDQARFDPGPFVYRGQREEGEGDLYIDWDLLRQANLTHLVKSVYLTKYGTRIEFHDAQRALELIGRHLGLFVDRREITGPDGGPQEIVIKGYGQEFTPDDWDTDTDATE